MTAGCMVMRAILILAVSGPVIEAATITPVEKVLNMMDEIKEKAIGEKKDEEVTFTTFSQWCMDTDRNKVSAINKSELEMAKQKALMQKLASEAVVLGKEIQGVDALIDAKTAERTKAGEVRATEHDDYVKSHEDYVTSIAELDTGLAKLKSMMSADQTSASSLIQKFVSNLRVPRHMQGVLTSFLATSASNSVEESLSAPEADKFASQSGGIMGMMDQLQEKMEQENTQLMMDETHADESYHYLAQDLTDQIEKQTALRNRRASTKKAKENGSAEAKTEFGMATQSRDSDSAYLTDLRSTCQQKTTDFESRQQLRAEEIDAIDKAIEIISSQSVAGSAAKHLPTLVEVGSSLSQLRSQAHMPAQSAAAAFLKMQGLRIDSHVLAALSVRITQDPFSKVKKMIKDMVIKLTEEANEETEHKGFCDTELATNKQTRDVRSADVDELTALHAELTATSNKLSSQIATLSDDIASTQKALAEATNLRHAEHEKNTATTADAKAAIQAVSQAIGVLKDYYAKAAGATALTQMSGVADDMPVTFDKPFQGQGAEGGILGMLEVILSDFQRLEASTTQNEEAGEEEFAKFSSDSNRDMTVKGQLVTDKTTSRTKTDSDAAETKADWDSNQAGLDAALTYFEKLKPSCVDAGLSYEDRVQRRNDEIQSLNEALKILSGEDMP